jgi:N6-L-threonylcarbamoyladenine synthase
MKIISLGIESSCDDTAASIVTSDKEILSNIVLSQIAEHQIYKGVVPEIASRSHMNYLEYAITEAIKESGISLEDISCISATGGPGLIGGVIVGTMFAKAISSVLKKPYIAVNHLEGHALTCRLTSEIEFPYLLLLISGGHCQFLGVKGVGDYILLGQTQDDSAGEAFDKVAKMLGLDYPGGPIIERLAKDGDENRFIFPMPMCDRVGCDMSFSGLKTAVRLLIEKEEINDQTVKDVCASFQKTVYQILQYKIDEAIKEYEKYCQNSVLVIAGGVASNQYLINKIKSSLSLKNYSVNSPPLKLCTDNAAMIAWAGIERYKNNMLDNLSFCPKARWSLY